MIGGITQNLYNRNINIDSNNRGIKIEKIYIGKKTDGEKKFLRVISNLQDLFGKYNLPAYREKEYLEAYNKLLKIGYNEDRILLAIYARVDKAINEDVNEKKFLETLSNPNYFVKSIDQLIIEADTKIKELSSIDKYIGYSIENDILPMKFLTSIYPEYLNLPLDYDGYFTDVDGETYSAIEECEYHFYLMKKFLADYDIRLADDIRFFIINNAIENIPYDILMKRVLFGLLHYQNKREYLEMYSSTEELSDLHNEELNFLQIDKNLDEVVEELEQRLVIE